MSEMSDEEKSEILAAEADSHTQAIARREPRTPTLALKQYLERHTPQLAQWAGDRIPPEDLIRFALSDYSRSEKLQRCSHASVYLSLIACAQLGLAPGGHRQEAFIVPFKNTAQFMIGYRGIITLAKRSGLVSSVVGNVIYERDDFDYDVGTTPFVTHKPKLVDRGPLIGAYAYAIQRDGTLEVEVMGLEDLEKVKRAAQARGLASAWREWESEMYRKAPIRRLGKRLPLGDDVGRAMALDVAQGMAGLRAALGVGDEVAREPARPAALQLSRGGADALRDALDIGEEVDDADD